MAPGFLERYKIVEEIGRGGMGRVIKALDVELRRLVAIKFVATGTDASFLRRFRQEARATALLRHPNIVTVFDVGQMDDESAFIVMEYVAGSTLDKRMRETAPPEWRAFLPIVEQCADALDFAHRRGIVHRDIKPSNIMIGDDGITKILDFGIAQVAAGQDASITQTGTLIGTPMYMAPENLAGRASIGPPADQYALALIAYTLLTGRHPFAERDPTGSAPTYGIDRLLYRIAHVQPQPPSSINPALPRRVDKVLLRALDKDPAQRFGSCRELFDDLSGSMAPPVGFKGLVSGIVSSFSALLTWQRPSPPVPAVPPADSTADGALPAPVTYDAGSSRPAPDATMPTAEFTFELPVASSAPEAAAPREFTREFAPPAWSEPPVPAPAPPPVSSEAQSVPDSPSEFTRMFGPSAGQASPAAPAPPPPAGPSAPGEFTQMFVHPEQTKLLRKAPDQRLDAESIARAQSRELVEMLERRDFENAVLLRGKWLPGIEGAPGELLGFSEAARYLGAAQEAVSAHVRIEHLKRSEKVLFSVGNQLLADTTAASRHLPAALEAWKTYARELLAASQHRAASELPNPFRAGQPLRPDQGRHVFRGRNALVRRIEAILADADQKSSLALLGPRRCGKTSLLQMLPAMLPDCACVFFDLQANPVSTVSQFFETLVRRAREQMRAQRQLAIPELDGEGTFENATRWLDQLDGITEVNRVLISIDEFERLEDLFPGDKRDLLRLMGLFRATIQHRQKVRLLVSGVAPFEELGSLWNDHFINVRELRIGHLDEETSLDLLSKPIPEFPPDAVPVAIAQRIFERTGGQPYLLQLFGTLLINRLNEQDRMRAQLDDVNEIEPEALSEGRYYFGNTYQDAPESARGVLEALARGEKPAISGGTRRWLERRWLIDDDGALRTPVLGAFIREELGM